MSADGGDVLVVADHRRGELRDVSFELVTAGRDLADALGGDLHVAVIAGDVDRLGEMLVEGIDTVHTVDDGEEFNHDAYVAAVEALYRELAPTALVMPNSVNGLDYAPAVANALDLPLVAGVVGLSSDGELELARGMYGSKVEATVAVEAAPFAVTVRPGEWPVTDETGGAEVQPFEFDADESTFGSRVLGFEEVGGGDVDLTYADLLVAVGRGIGSAENLDLVYDLVEATGGRSSRRGRSSTAGGWTGAGRSASPGSTFGRPSTSRSASPGRPSTSAR